MIDYQQKFLTARNAHQVDYAALAVSTPCYILDVNLLQLNAQLLADVARDSGAEILLALKAFASFATFPYIKNYFAGTCASSLDEARLAAEKFGGEVHVFSPAFREREVADYLRYASHFSFNSFAQFTQFREKFSARSLGLRINPEHREVETALYDPCRVGSRLGICARDFIDQDLRGVEGLHFHNLCEKNAEALVRTLSVVEKNFAPYLQKMKWLNCGGGHHITRADYDVALLVKTMRELREKYAVQIYLEPGEAVALNAGFLVAEVIDLFNNDGEIAIVDVSAATHTPDVLEMPYRPQIIGAGLPHEKKYTYRLGGPSCLAGDEIGEYSFAEKLTRGSRLVFTDMAHYSIVKNNTFNGIRLPSIYLCHDGIAQLVKHFSYDDFLHRLS